MGSGSQKSTGWNNRAGLYVMSSLPNPSLKENIEILLLLLSFPHRCKQPEPQNHYFLLNNNKWYRICPTPAENWWQILNFMVFWIKCKLLLIALNWDLYFFIYIFLDSAEMDRKGGDTQQRALLTHWAKEALQALIFKLNSNNWLYNPHILTALQLGSVESLFLLKVRSFFSLSPAACTQGIVWLLIFSLWMIFLVLWSSADL